MANAVVDSDEMLDLDTYLPAELRDLPSPQIAIPAIAKNPRLMALIQASVSEIPTHHQLFQCDSRQMKLPDESVQLVVTSPPYWNLKKYRNSESQLGHWEDYEDFLKQLDQVWKRCYRALVPGGRMVCVVGDVCLSRKKNNGRHTVVPLHASIQEHCRLLGFDNLSPIIWHKIANAVYEAEGSGGGFMGKPYEPNAVIKNDIEFILMERKPGGYRSPTLTERILSIISEPLQREWFQQIWTGVTGASTKNHPAPYPVELANRLIRMFSFVGDTVLDPFLGTGTTSLAAMQCGRNSIGVEVDPVYSNNAKKRISDAIDLLNKAKVTFHDRSR